MIAEKELASAENRWSEALISLEALYDLMSEKGLNWHRARTLLDWAIVHASRGEKDDVERAKQLYCHALALFTEMGADGYMEVVVMRAR